MGVFECKSCGRLIKFGDNQITVICENCGKEYSVAEIRNYLNLKPKYSGSNSTEPLIRRAFLFLEDRDFKSAKEYGEKVLDLEPENAKAYLVKLMAELKVSKKEDLKNVSKSLEKNKNYEKIMRFGDNELKQELSNYIIDTKGSRPKNAKKGKKFAIIITLLVLVITAIFVIAMVLNKQDDDYNYSGVAYFETRSPREEMLIDMKNWENIVGVSVGSHSVGLMKDGTVIATGYNWYEQCNVSEWKDIISVSVGSNHTVGLKKDGTVVAVGNNEYGQCDVSDWGGMMSVSACGDYTVGLKKDGTVVAIGSNEYGQCNVSDWTDIVAVSAGLYNIAGLKKDGTVVVSGNDEFGQCDTSDWEDIIEVSAGQCYILGLKKDGTVVAAGYNEDGRCDVSEWENIVSISAGNLCAAGITEYGTVVDTRDYRYGKYGVSAWGDIVEVDVGAYTVGLRENGTVVIADDL